MIISPQRERPFTTRLTNSSPFQGLSVWKFEIEEAQTVVLNDVQA